MLKKPILLPIAGLDFSIPSTIVRSETSFAKNCNVKDGVIVPREGNDDYSDVALTGAIMSGAVLHLGRMQQSDQTLLMTRFSDKRSNVYNSGTDKWDDITKSGTEWTTTEGTDFYDSAVYIDTLIVTNGKDNIQKYTGTGLCADLGGSPPKAKYIETVSEYVMLANITDGGTAYPWRIQWNDTGEIEDWSTGNSGSFDLLENDERIVGMRKFNENLVVFKEKSIYIGRPVDTTDIWNFDLIESGSELLNNRCIVFRDGKLYYLSVDGNVYSFNGYSSVRVGNKIGDRIRTVLNQDRLGMSFGRYNTYNKCVEFFICQNGYDYCNFKWALNVEDGSIYYDTFTNGLAAQSTFKDTSGQLAYNDFADTVTYANIDRYYDEDLGGTGFEFKLLGSGAGKVLKNDNSYQNDDGSAIEQEFITKDINLDDHERLNRWSHVIMQLLGTRATVYYSTDFGATYTVIPKNSTTQYYDLTNAFTSYPIWLDLKSQYIRYRVVNVDTNSYFNLRQLAIYGELAEEVWK